MNAFALTHTHKKNKNKRRAANVLLNFIFITSKTSETFYSLLIACYICSLLVPFCWLFVTFCLLLHKKF